MIKKQVTCFFSETVYINRKERTVWLHLIQVIFSIYVQYFQRYNWLRSAILKSCIFSPPCGVDVLWLYVVQDYSNVESPCTYWDGFCIIHLLNYPAS